jgi:uncharacterized membrane protein YhaH (DUF805 family)
MKTLHRLLFSSPIDRLAFLGRSLFVDVVCLLPVYLTVAQFNSTMQHLLVLGKSAFSDPDAVLAEAHTEALWVRFLTLFGLATAVIYTVFFTAIPRLRSIGLSPWYALWFLLFVGFTRYLHLPILSLLPSLFLLFFPPRTFEELDEKPN